jgi:Dr1-associated corepressor
MDEHGTYAPQSPDLSAFQTSFSPKQPINSYYPSQQPHQHSQPQYQVAPFAQTAAYNPTSYSVQQYPTPYHPPAMANNGHSPGWKDDGDPEWTPEYPKGGSARKLKKQKVEVVCDKPAPGVEEGIEVKTKFPVARIKRIMQADEDVGKVSQVTPTAVCESLDPIMADAV